MSDHLAHDAPLVELVARLHAGTDLRERVVRLRYRRKRPSAGQAGGAVDSGCSAAIGSRLDPLSGDAQAGHDIPLVDGVRGLGDAPSDPVGGGNVNNESEVGGE